MIPFLKNKQDASASAPVDSIKREPDEESDYDGLEACVEDLCHAIEKKDYKAGASALRAAFELMEASPHEEGEHIG
jgi:hypothetical protein